MSTPKKHIVTMVVSHATPNWDCALIGLFNPEWDTPVQQFTELPWQEILDARNQGMSICGYGIKSTLIAMLRKSWALEVSVPVELFNPCKAKWCDSIVDLRDVWNGGGDDNHCPLAEVLKQLGLPPKTGTGAESNAADLRAEYALAVALGI